MILKWLVTSAMLCASVSLVWTTATAQAIFSPPQGSPERRAILDAIRPKAEAELGAPVKFVVKTIRADGGWAYVDVRPQRPDGKPIKIQRPDLMDAYADALLQKRNGRWAVLDFRLGATDVWYCEFSGRVPKKILGPDC